MLWRCGGRQRGWMGVTCAMQWRCGTCQRDMCTWYETQGEVGWSNTVHMQGKYAHMLSYTHAEHTPNRSKLFRWNAEQQCTTLTFTGLHSATHHFCMMQWCIAGTLTCLLMPRYACIVCGSVGVTVCECTVHCTPSVPTSTTTACRML